MPVAINFEFYVPFFILGKSVKRKCGLINDRIKVAAEVVNAGSI